MARCPFSRELLRAWSPRSQQLAAKTMRSLHPCCRRSKFRRARRRSSGSISRAGRARQRYTGQQRDMVRYIFSKHNHFDADQLIDEMKPRGLPRQPSDDLPNPRQTRRRRPVAPPRDRPTHLLRARLRLPAARPSRLPVLSQDDRVPVRRSRRRDPRRLPAHGFQMQGHSFVIRGTCADCNRARVTKRRLDLV